VCAYLREGEGGSSLVVVNFAANGVTAQVIARAGTRWTPVFDTIEPPAPAFVDGTALALRPYEAAIFRRPEPDSDPGPASAKAPRRPATMAAEPVVHPGDPTCPSSS
jgi:hypothetical protein